MRLLEPPVEQALAGIRRADVAAVAKLLSLSSQLRHQRRHELVHARFAQRLIGRKPANLRDRGSRAVSRGNRDAAPLLFPPTLTSTMVIVSLPKMSTTLTAILRRPGWHSRGDARQFQRAVLLGAEALPFVFEDVITGPDFFTPKAIDSFSRLPSCPSGATATRMISRLLSKSKSTDQ